MTLEMHSMKNLDKSIKVAGKVLPVDNQKMLAEWHKDEKVAIALLIVGILLPCG